GRGGSGGAAGQSDSGASGAAGEGGQGGAVTACKRGIAANTAPGSAFSPALGWWYNWSIQGTGSAEFVPMMWGGTSVSATIPANAKFLLTFNEPNFHAQSNLTAQAAADLWPMLEPKAK